MCRLCVVLLVALVGSGCSGTPENSVGTSAVGEGADYVYDSSGNILQIRPGVATGVAIVDFQSRPGTYTLRLNPSGPTAATLAIQHTRR